MNTSVVNYNSCSSARIQKAVRQFIGDRDWSRWFAVTLTLRQARLEATPSGTPVWLRLTDSRASQNFRHFANLLSARAYPTAARRAGKRVRVIPVLEGGGTDLRWHYHAMIECPRDEMMGSFPLLIDQCWRKTDWGYDQVKVTAEPNLGWVNYMTKLRTKTDFASAIDWMNFTD